MPNGNGYRKKGAARRPSAPLAIVAIVVAIVLASGTTSAERLRIVATTTDLASLARAVTGDFAQVETIVPPATDPEAFEPRPADLARLKGAAVVARVGLGYDHWLDKLLSTHGDPAVNRRGAGYVDASLGIPLLEVRGSSVNPASQDGHAHGLANPHYWLDPTNAEIITGGIAEAVIRVSPGLADRIVAAHRDFLARLKMRLADWEQLLSPHRGAHFIAYHNTWPYFARRFRLNIVDVIESKEGVTPSPARLAHLAATIRTQRIRVIVHEPFEPDDTPQLLARRTGAAVVKLAPSVGSVPAVRNYTDLFDYDVGMLAQAFSAAPK